MKLASRSHTELRKASGNISNTSMIEAALDDKRKRKRCWNDDLGSSVNPKNSKSHGNCYSCFHLMCRRKFIAFLKVNSFVSFSTSLSQLKDDKGFRKCVNLCKTQRQARNGRKRVRPCHWFCLPSSTFSSRKGSMEASGAACEMLSLGLIVRASPRLQISCQQSLRW